MSLLELNIQLFWFINNLGIHYPFLNKSMIFIAEYTIFMLALFVLVHWFSRNAKKRIMVICASLTFLIAELLGKFAGTLHSNQQPFAMLQDVNQLIEKAVNNSFPSDHTILFFSFCMTFAIFHKKTAILWISIAVLVGISRIWVGVHYPADIFVGALISSVTAITVYITLGKSLLVVKLLTRYEKIERKVLLSSTKSKDY
ncbi:undecaprenyl-diphosphatase [Bacillus sp. BGMRC 2118]|nr:undecaprenyl-diphosphatase [Bacillus sp. BGMRC 2118]